MNRKERVQDELWDFMGLDLCRDVCLGGWLIGKRQWGKRVGGGRWGGGGSGECGRGTRDGLFSKQTGASAKAGLQLYTQAEKLSNF